VAPCFAPERERAAPHAMLGMVQIVTVGAPVAPASTPHVG
jgi:hypothetical protein